jgi:hypothetical protein
MELDTISNVHNFAIYKLIQGPTLSEKNFSKLKNSFVLTGASNCGEDYILSKSNNNKTITIKFCKNVKPYVFPDGVSGATLKAQQRFKISLNQTLRIDEKPNTPGYQGIDIIKLLDKNNQCLFPDVEVNGITNCN